MVHFRINTSLASKYCTIITHCVRQIFIHHHPTPLKPFHGFNGPFNGLNSTFGSAWFNRWVGIFYMKIDVCDQMLPCSLLNGQQILVWTFHWTFQHNDVNRSFIKLVFGMYDIDCASMNLCPFYSENMQLDYVAGSMTTWTSLRTNPLHPSCILLKKVVDWFNDPAILKFATTVSMTGCHLICLSMPLHIWSCQRLVNIWGQVERNLK